MQMPDNPYRMTKICVDSYEDRVLKGRLYNPFSEAPIFFNSTMEFLVKMEDMMNAMEYPQHFSEMHSFQKPKAIPSPPFRASKEQSGSVCTFMIRVLFRQNASWQGQLTWTNEKRKCEQCFRSVLELLLLIDSAAYSD